MALLTREHYLSTRRRDGRSTVHTRTPQSLQRDSPENRPVFLVSFQKAKEDDGYDDRVRKRLLS